MEWSSLVLMYPLSCPFWLKGPTTGEGDMCDLIENPTPPHLVFPVALAGESVHGLLL